MASKPPTSASSTNAFRGDTMAPQQPTGGLLHDALSDTAGGPIGSTSDVYTANRAPTLTGSAAKGARVRVQVGSQTFNTTASQSDGSWSVKIVFGLRDGDHTPLITVIDAAGNETQSGGTLFSVDCIAPQASAITARLMPSASNDTGTLSDHVTSLSQPQIGGTAEAMAHVALVIDGKTYATTADIDGNWSVTVGSAPHPTHALTPAPYALSVTVTDRAGNATTQAGTALTVQAASGDPSLTLLSGNNTDRHARDTSLAASGVLPDAKAVEYRVIKAGSEVLDWTTLAAYNSLMASSAPAVA